MNTNVKILKDSYRLLFTGAFLCLIAMVLMYGTKGTFSNIATIINTLGCIVLFFGFGTIGFSMIRLLYKMEKAKKRQARSK